MKQLHSGCVCSVYLCGELLVLLRQDPGTGVEVVLFWEQLLHSPHCPTHVDLPQHFDHSCNAQRRDSETKLKMHLEI